MTNTKHDDGQQTEAGQPAAGEKRDTGAPAVRAKFTWWQLTGVIAVSSLIGSAVGATAGYYAALTTPIPPSVAVVDMEGAAGIAVELLQKKEIHPDQAAAFVATIVKERIAGFRELGVVVIDKAAVVDVPPELEVDVAKLVTEKLSKLNEVPTKPAASSSRRSALPDLKSK